MISWYVFAIISAIFSAIAAIFEKKALFKEFALNFSVVFGVITMFLAIPFLFFVDYSKISLIAILVLLFKVFLGAFAFLCVMKGLKDLEISNALPLLVLTPGLVAVFAFVFLGESLKSFEILGLILLIIGIYTMQLKGGEKILDPFKNFIKSKYHYPILLALVIFTTTAILDKALLSKFSLPVNAFIAFQYLFSAIFMLSFVFLFGKPKELKKTFKRSFFIILLISAFTIVYRYTEIISIKSAPVALALAIKRTSVFFAVLIGGKIFKDKNYLTKIIATAIMVIGAMLIVRG
jgi:drug/metabolite transporter (DMT)-like permease